VEEVATQLAESAPRFARDSLASLSAGDAVGFALYAATSLEHLSKCYLARRHPALIVDGKSLDSLLHACGQGGVARRKRDEVKTISAAESFNRATRFLPLLAAHVESTSQLFDVRNGGVHLADRRSIDPFVLPFLKASEILREALELDRDEYWGEYVKLADSTLREHVEEAELKAEAAVAAAKTRYAERFGGLDQRQLELAIAGLEANTFHGYNEQPAKCPACDSTALATGEVETEWHYDEVGGDEFLPTLEAEFFPETLKCHVCGLALDDADELRAAGVEPQWSLDLDPDDFIQEPDEDYFRGR
jgi:hypothetical protein